MPETRHQAGQNGCPQGPIANIIQVCEQKDRLCGSLSEIPIWCFDQEAALAGCGETANQPQKNASFVMRLTLNHDACD